MSNSAKKSPPSRSKTAQSTSAASERKPALSIIKDIQRQTRRQYTAEEKIRIVYARLLHTNLKADNIFAGIVSIAALVIPEHETGDALKAKFPPGIPIISADKVADQHWALHTERTSGEAIVGDVEQLLAIPGLHV